MFSIFAHWNASFERVEPMSVLPAAIFLVHRTGWASKCSISIWWITGWGPITSVTLNSHLLKSGSLGSWNFVYFLDLKKLIIEWRKVFNLCHFKKKIETKPKSCLFFFFKWGIQNLVISFCCCCCWSITVVAKSWKSCKNEEKTRGEIRRENFHKSLIARRQRESEAPAERGLMQWASSVQNPRRLRTVKGGAETGNRRQVTMWSG